MASSPAKAGVQSKAEIGAVAPPGPRPSPGNRSLRFAGYAAVFGRPGRGGDIVRNGAFAKALESAGEVPLLWQHKAGAVIGRVEHLSEDEHGQILDILVAGTIEEPPRATPPASPLLGACYVVDAGATDSWAGMSGTIAAWTTGGWRFVSPVEGATLYERTSGTYAAYRNGTWELGTLRGNVLNIGGKQVVGQRAAAIGPCRRICRRRRRTSDDRCDSWCIASAWFDRNLNKPALSIASVNGSWSTDAFGQQMPLMTRLRGNRPSHNVLFAVQT